MRSSLALALATLLLACGGTAIVDPDDGSDDDGSGASGAGTPTGTSTGTATGTSTGTTTGTPTGQPFEPDGIATRVANTWRLRIASFPVDCPTKDAPAPFDECGWYDIEISLAVNELDDDFVITPGSGIGMASFASAEPGDAPDCPGAGGGGELFGNVTIVDVQDDRVVVELGSGWSIVTFDGALSPVGQHTLALCD